MKIAIAGTRGIPASYGGFETFAEQLSTRLVDRGHEVTVYNRRAFGEAYDGPEEFEGVRIRAVPTIMHKYLETPLSSLFAFVDLFRNPVDAVLLCNAANSPFSWLVRLRGIPLFINVDGIERKRKKWNMAGRLWYRLGELCSVLFASRVIADADVISDYYKERYKSESTVIAYGAEAVRQNAGETLEEFGIEKDNYILYVSRLEPENNALGVVEAYNSIETDMPLVIVGDAPYAEDYKKKLQETAGEGVVFTGFQFGKAYQELQTNCSMYIQATEVGGTHPALIEAMAYGNAVIANGTSENLEVLADAGLFYEVNDFVELSVQMKKYLNEPETAASFGQKAAARTQKVYSWDAVTSQYEELFGEYLRPCSKT